MGNPFQFSRAFPQVPIIKIIQVKIKINQVFKGQSLFRPHYWVVTLDDLHDGRLVFWESLTGQQYNVHVDKHLKIGANLEFSGFPVSDSPLAFLCAYARTSVATGLCTLRHR